MNTLMKRCNQILTNVFFNNKQAISNDGMKRDVDRLVAAMFCITFIEKVLSFKVIITFFSVVCSILNILLSKRIH